jgi:hypothetical protein
MNLPDTKTGPLTDFSNYSTLIYGSSKIGKSTFCSKVPDILFLSTEPGLNALNTYQTTIKTWPDFLNAAAEIAKGKHNFKAICVDTIDNAALFASDWICAKNSVSHPSELAYGKGFSLVNQELQRVLTKLASLPYGLFLISHANEKEISTRTGKYMKVVPSLTGGVAKVVLALVDIILYFDNVVDEKSGTESRIIHTKPSKFYDAGDRAGRLPEEIEMNYDKLIKSFNSGQKETKNG